MLDSNTIRRMFLEYFQENGHEVVPGSPLIPANDPTLLFTNAGMVQFKDVFLGLDKRSYSRAVTSQCCIRAGGKHNDLENVGYTTRHHTFFEMLGNFSFGDYFKREAIQFAWDFLTVKLKLPPDRLWMTVYQDDDEAADIWLKEIGVDSNRFSRCGEKDNFWSMGDTGPCGPCSEIFYDHGETIPGGPPGSPDQEGDRYVEIWNLVFMQYDRDAGGNMKPLPNPSVDTGMGLERIAAVVQGVHSNYDTDTFRYLIKAINKLTGKEKAGAVSPQVIADHIRSCAFLIADGVVPANEGRGYVLRRIIRRAIRHGSKLGLHEPFFYRLVEPLVAVMGEAYPNLKQSQQFVERTLRSEEERFGETLEQGLGLLEAVIEGLTGKTIPGADVFRLYDTYGFPVDLTADIARERGLILDMDGFEQAMDAQRERARAASKFDMKLAFNSEEITGYASEFRGYEHLELKSVVTGIFAEGRKCNELPEGQAGGIILEATPFYAESGGQVGDKGTLTGDGVIFEVTDTQKQGKAHIHLGRVLQGTVVTGQGISACVDMKSRMDTMRNHSVTHLMHKALRDVLGPHVQQKGSLVDAEKTRFDFSHDRPMTDEEIRQVERRVNAEIMQNTPTQAKVMPIEEAKKSGAMMLFGEKYGDEVRVLEIGSSREFCGGTHVARTGDIGVFKIYSEGGVAAGVRRVEATTGGNALAMIENQLGEFQVVANHLRARPSGGMVEKAVVSLLEEKKTLEKEISRLRSKIASGQGVDLAGQAVEVMGARVVAATLDGADVKTLRQAMDRLKDQLQCAAIVLGTVHDGKVSLIAGVTPDLIAKVKAGELVNFVASQVGGKGGGRPDMAQAGGNDPTALPAALASVPDWVRAKL